MTNPGKFVDKRAQENEWFTPPLVRQCLNVYFDGQIPLDPATASSNPTGAAKFYTEDDDGLAQPWDRPWFVNPPYSITGEDELRQRAADLRLPQMLRVKAKEELRQRREALKQRGVDLFGLKPKQVSSPIVLWAAKIHQSAAQSGRGREGIALLPCGARYSTEYWQDHILIPELTATCWVRGRVAFVHGPTGKKKSGQNNYDSQIYGYNVQFARFARAFKGLGAVFELSRHDDPRRRLRRRRRRR